MRKLITLTILLAILLIPTADAKLPFIVKTVYFQPQDAPAVPADQIKNFMKDTQAFYRSEMIRHGYGQKTFRLETDNDGVPIIHIVKGKNPPHTYTSYQALEPELPRDLRNQNNIHVFFMGGMQFVKPGAWGVGYPLAGGVCGGITRIATLGEGMRLSVIAHELGHAFGLYHNIRQGDFVMGPGRNELDDYEARWLDKHHYFNDVHEINAVPKIVKVHETEHTAIKVKGAEFEEKDGVRFQIDVESSNEFHQAQILRGSDVAIVGWTKLSGKRPIAVIDALRSDLLRDRTAYFEVMDVLGNYTIHTLQFTLPKVPPLPEEEVEEERTDERDVSVTSLNKLTVIWARLKLR